MRYERLTLTAIVCLLALGLPLHAQEHPSIERGIAPDKAYSVGEIDAVSLFNGSLSIAIPVGQTYAVGGNLSYGLTLTYTSSVWDLWVDQVQACTPPYDDMELLRSDPVITNAGLGWNLSLGEIRMDGSAVSPGFVYVSADGAQHRFFDTLHNGESAVAGVAYTRDGSYLRLKYSNYVWCGEFKFWQNATIEFPNGNIHTFVQPSSCSETMRPTSLADVYGNTLTITYEATRWVLQDTHGRTHYVNFGAYGVSSVDLDAFDDPNTAPNDRATYIFGYSTQTIARSCKEEYSLECPGHNRPTSIAVNLLTSVALPDGSSWSMVRWDNSQPGYNLDPAGICTSEPTMPKDRPGTLTHLTAPTGGRFMYTYGKWENPSGGASCYYSTSERNAVLESTGVTQREVSDPITSVSGTWAYAHNTHRIGNDVDPTAQESWTVVSAPDADDTKHWFRTRYCLDGPTSEGWDYGLPLTRGQNGGANPPFTSVQYYDGSVASGTLKRTQLVTYDHDALLGGGGNAPADEWIWHNTNRRVNYERTVFADDGNRWTDVTSYTSTYDGLGHFRTVSTNGNFETANYRSTTTNFNPAAGNYPGTTFVVPSTSLPWIITTYDYATQTEAGVTARQEYCFEANKGFLQRVRTLKTGTSRGNNDLLAVYSRSTAGNLTSERSFGGDAQSIATTSGCSWTLPATDVYRIDHGYAYGTRNSSAYANSSGTPLAFKVLDCDVDLSTGMYSACRDTAGIQTNFLYDPMSRVTWAKPVSGHGAYLHNQYLKYGTCSGPPKVETCAKTNGTTTECVNTAQSCNPIADSLTRSALQFDGLGRVTGEFTKYNATDWNQRLTTYDGNGRRISVSEWQPSGTTGASIKATVYSGFDPFGRPTTITPPDGTSHNITLAYLGTRQVTRTLKVFSDTGGTPATERDAVTTELYDRQGRLLKLTEQAGAGGADVATSYGYDVGNRLARVCASPHTLDPWCTDPNGTNKPTQRRLFTYDNRGFLTSEQLPEIGAAGNGTTSYPYYDARGHALRTFDGLNYVKLAYDRAERLTTVRQSTSGWADGAVLRQLAYADANNGLDMRKGKLQTATAYNIIGSTPFPVVETYTYAGVGGRVSRRQTFIDHVDTVDDRTINLDLNWTDLGKPYQVFYPDDTGIADPARTLTHTYTMGMLTGITGYASSIQYHPNLMLKQLVNGNNVTWTQQIADGQSGRPLDAMARPYSIGITGASSSWSLGPYAYDGAGNIKSVTAGALSETYVYDKVLRMTSGTIVTAGVNRTQTAQYSPYGFITSLTTNGSGQTFNETMGTNRISGASYNAAGSMTGWGSYSYTWDPLKQMASTYGSGFTKRTFLYTADGERVEERVGSDPLNPSSIVVSARGLDGKVLRLLTKNGTWGWTKDYVYRDGAQLATVEPPVATPVTKYLHLDHLRTIRRITNTASPAAIIASHDYYPFGLEATDPSQDSERMKWTGHERDQQGTPSVQTDDLDYMHARFENFNIGRFLSIDPVRGNPKRPQSFNLFAYVGNNPINFVDPLGLFANPARPAWEGGPIIVRAEDPCPWIPSGLPCNSDSWVEFLRWLEEHGVTPGTPEYASAVLGGAGLIASPVAQGADLLARGFHGLTGWVDAVDALLSEGDPTDAGVSVAVALIPGGIDNLVVAPIRHMRLIKKLTYTLSKEGVALSPAKLEQLRRVIEKAGGSVSAVRAGEQGRGALPHVHIEGFGRQVRNRHINVGGE